VAYRHPAIDRDAVPDARDRQSRTRRPRSPPDLLVARSEARGDLGPLVVGDVGAEHP
jgi:hypothetical protein